MTYFPEGVLEHILSFLTSHRDRNAAALVCRRWHCVERLSRHKVFIGNCYSIRPERALARFPCMRSLSVKGMPHFADFDLVPAGWGAGATPWVEACATVCPGLEELRLKRMVVTDECLELLSRAFPNFKSLVLVSCEGFSTDGLAAIAANCRFLRELDLHENMVEDRGPHWISCFPESYTSLESLNFACLAGEVNTLALQRLVARCPNLRSLRLNRTVSVDALTKIVARAPKLVDLGTGSFAVDPRSNTHRRLMDALRSCKSLKSLSGLWDASRWCLAAIHPVCMNLTCLNLSYAPAFRSADLIVVIRHCFKLQRFWVLDFIGDKGLEVVASSCKELQELRVFPSDVDVRARAAVTEVGLVAVSSGCPKLNSVLYFCHQMTNAALITVAKNCPRFTRFRLCILEPGKPDPVTGQPLDEGFGAIVKSCNDLRRLSMSGLLTDQVFLYIGMYAERLEMLSVAFAGDTDKGMIYVLNGCKNLRKLEIRDSPFGDAALLEGMHKYEAMRSLWMSSCGVTLEGCKSLAAKMPRLNVEVMNESALMDESEESPNNARKVEKMYVYRTTAGPRDDAPEFVSIF